VPQPALNSTSKKRSFAEAFDPKRNAFGFLRLALAILVIFSHTFPLGGFGPEPLVTLTQGRHTIGLVAVAMFFVLSGFLITRSASRSVSVARFVWHRFLRIFPGYWVCLIVCAFVFAPLIALVEHGTVVRVFSAPRGSPQEYVLHNAGLFHLNDFSLIGVVNIWPQGFAGLLSRVPTPHIINGSLWTLPFEVACYTGVAALALCGLVRRGRLVFLASFVGLWVLYAHSYLFPQSFGRYFPVPGLQVFVPLALSFSAGCLCFVYREKIPYSGWIFAGCLILLPLSFPLGIFGLAAPVFMTYAFFWLAFTFSFPRFDAKGDYSYGTYIYAFPVQQALALAEVQEEGVAAYFGASLLITLMLAVLSYRLVEAPCLQWKNVDVVAALRARFRRSRLSDPVATASNARGAEA
jgi:peptidoglycan/LPS O-acetylase OafA/YrhL